MASQWPELSSKDPLRVAKAASALNRRRHMSITSDQARAVVTALNAQDTGTRLQTWPELLKLLGSWASQLTGAATGLPQTRPLRPWERKPQQEPSVSQQVQQQQADTFQLLEQAVATVVAALIKAAAAGQSAYSEDSRKTTKELIAILGPALGFLASAITAAAALQTAGGIHASQELQATAVAASCTAITAAMPALLTADDLALMPAVLSSYQRVLVASKDDPQHLCWLVTCLLAALQDALPASLLQLHAAASSSTPGSATPATLQDWAAQQTQEYVTTRVIGQLVGLYTLGHAVGLATCRAAASAAAAAAAAGITQPVMSSGNSMQASTAAKASVLQGFAAVSQLLQLGCSHADHPSTAAVPAAVAAGLLAASLEAYPHAVARGAAAPAAPAAAAGSSSDVWASATQQMQQQQHLQEVSETKPSWQLDLEQQQQLLLQAVDMACQQIFHAVTSYPAAAGTPTAGVQSQAAAATFWCQLLSGHAYSRLMATHSLAVQQIQQTQSMAGLQCSLAYVMHSCCGLSGLMHLAGCCSDPAAANAWLAAQQQQHPAHEVGLLARWLAEATSSLPGDQQQQLLQAVRLEADAVANSYDCYLLSVTQPEVLQQVGAVAVRQQLDRVFATVVSALAAVWQHRQQQVPLLNPEPRAPAPIQGSRRSSSDSDPRNAAAMVVAQGLAALAALQFCQVQLPAYVDLLRGLVGTLASSSTAADAFLSDALPCYNALVQGGDESSSSSSNEHQCTTGSIVSCECSSKNNGSLATAGSSSSAAHPWLASPVLIARLSFLLPLIPVACKAASDGAAATTRVLPLVLLLLPHPVRQLSEVAHSAFAGLLTAVAEAAAAEEDGASAEGEQQQHSAFAALQQAIPFYLQRSVEGLPHSGSLEGLAIGFSSILKQLPAGNVMSLLAVTKVTECAATWAQQAAAEGQPVVHAPVSSRQRGVTADAEPNTGGPAPAQGSSASCTAAARLFELVQLSLQLVDYQVLPSALQHIAGVVVRAPADVQQQWIQGLYAACIANDDYARKPALIQWIDGLNRDSLQVRQNYGAAISAERKERDDSSEPAQHGGQSAQPPFLVA